MIYALDISVNNQSRHFLIISKMLIYLFYNFLNKFVVCCRAEKLGHSNKHRRSMLARQVKDLVNNERIVTTETRAK